MAGYIRPLVKERSAENATKEEREYMADVARLGCIICRKLGLGETPAEVHHRRKLTGAGRRAPHSQVIPLCVEHHRGNEGIHGMGRRAWEFHYSVDEVELVEEVRGLVDELRRRNVAWRA